MSANRIHLYFSGSFPEGNSNNARIRQYALALNDAGFQVKLFSFFPSRFESEQVASWHGMPFNYISRSNDYPRRKLNRYIQLLLNPMVTLFHLIKHRKDVDKVMFFNPRLIDGLFLMTLYKRLKKQIVVDQVELFSARHQGFKWQERLIARKADVLCLISDRLLVHFNNLNSKGLLLKVPVMVDMERFGDVTPQEQKYKVGYIGNFDFKDNIEDLILAVKMASERLPQIELLLLGFDPFEEEHKQLALDLKMGDKVHFSGRLPYSSVAPLLKSCDTLVVNRTKDSFSTYGYPIKLAEYFAAGRTVLISEIGGFDNELEDQIQVFKYEADSAKALADCILKRYDETQNADRIAETGRRFAEEHFTTSHLAKFISKLTA